MKFSKLDRLAHELNEVPILTAKVIDDGAPQTHTALNFLIH